MNIKKLTIFYKTAQCLNMSKVAKDMYISQPAVSQYISEIEAEVGAKFFDRIGKKLYLTHEGEIFLNYTQRILNLYEEGVSKVKDYSHENKGKITIGATTIIGVYIMPYIIKKFNEREKEIEISLIIDNKKNIEKLLSNNEIDIAFIENKSQLNEISINHMWKDELVFISSNSYKWSNKEYITPRDLKSSRFILREDGCGVREIFETYLKSKGIEYSESIYLGNIEAIINYVKLGMGVSCVPYITVIQKEKIKKLNIHRLKNCKIERVLYMAVHKDKYISSAMKYFIKFCEEVNLYE